MFKFISLHSQMSGIIDIRVITEAPVKLAAVAGIVFFCLSHWHMPGLFSGMFNTLPGFGSLNPFTQIEVIKSLIVALVVWFVLRYKRKWALDAIQVDAPPAAISKPR